MSITESEYGAYKIYAQNKKISGIASMHQKIAELKQHLKDPLYKNSIFLIASSITGAGSGFIFWIFAARFYSAEDIGLASAIISAMGLISILSRLGFDISLARYIPEREDKKELINSCLTISFIFSIALALIFIGGIDIWSPSLNIIRDNKFLLLLFLIFTAMLTLVCSQQYGVFVGFRKTEYSFMQTIVILVRIGIVPFLVSFGAIGIYASYGLTFVLAFVLGIFLISKVSSSYKPIPGIKKEIVSDLFHFSLGNYFATIFELLPTFVLPIMVINILGAETNAYFFIAWQISIFLLAIPRFTSMSLLAEGSYDRAMLERDTRRALKFIFLLLIPVIIGIFLFGKYLLWVFGEEYARNSFEILVILCIASIPSSFNMLYATVKRIKEELKMVIFIFGFITFFTLLGSYLLIQHIGLIGIGIAWLIGNGIIAGGIGLGAMKDID